MSSSTATSVKKVGPPLFKDLSFSFRRECMHDVNSAFEALFKNHQEQNLETSLASQKKPDITSQKVACIKSISFAEIVHGRDASVQVTDDHLLFAVDLVMVMTGNERDYSSQLIRRMPDSSFDSKKFIRRRVRKGGPLTKLLTMEDSIQFLMVIPGENAKIVRKQFSEIIIRYLDGDLTMCNEIKTHQAMGKLKSYSQFARKVMSNIDNEDSKRAQEMPQTNYVYATKTPAFPGLIKIGKTMDVTKRLSGLNTACAPAPHVIVAVAPTFDEDRDEKTAHAFFSSARREGEFFELQDAAVLAFFATHITAQYNKELVQNISRLQGLK